MDVVEDWSKVDRFAAASIKEGNQPRRYHFYIVHGNNYKPGEIISGPVFDGKAIMKTVKNRLKEENWISENVIETPLKTKIDGKDYCSFDQYIQQVVSEALETESPKIFRFLQYLHRNYK